MRAYLRLSVLGAVATSTALLVAGCGTHHAGHTGAAPSPSASPPSASSSPSTAPGRMPLPGAKQNGPTVSVVGTLTRGAEPSCVVLRTSAGQSFQLVGRGAKSVTAGLGHRSLEGALPVRVKGHIGPNVASFCQVGRPFVSDTVTVRH